MAGVIIHPVEIKGRDLPPLCVVTGDPTSTYVKWSAQRKHSAWAFLLLLFGVLPFLIYLVATSRSFTLELPATPAVQQRLYDDRRTYWFVGLAGAAIAITNAFVAGWWPVTIIGLALVPFALFLRFFFQGRDWISVYLDADGSVHLGGCSATFAAAVEAWRPTIPTS